MLAGKLKLRTRPRREDRAPLARLVASTGVFNRVERRTAVELLEERLAVGIGSGYLFSLADLDGELAGYCVYGPVPLTIASYDLYWIAVGRDYQGRGVGRALLTHAERDIARRGGEQVYIETSARAPYRRTRRFYRAAGYRLAARFKHFYAPGDDKLVYEKRLGPR